MFFFWGFFWGFFWFFGFFGFFILFLLTSVSVSFHCAKLTTTTTNTPPQERLVLCSLNCQVVDDDDDVRSTLGSSGLRSFVPRLYGAFGRIFPALVDAVSLLRYSTRISTTLLRGLRFVVHSRTSVPCPSALVRLFCFHLFVVLLFCCFVVLLLLLLCCCCFFLSSQILFFFFFFLSVLVLFRLTLLDAVLVTELGTVVQCDNHLSNQLSPRAFVRFAFE